MLHKIKNKLNQELKIFIKDIDQFYRLKGISPVLSNSIKEFLLRDGKRIRPILLIIGFKAFSRKNPFGLYKCALSLELLHDFMLVHDDIIDRSNKRRGKSSMHKMLGDYLKRYPNCKSSGSDLAIVTADVMYALAIHAFLSIKIDFILKEKALRKFIEATVFTGSGEFIELLYSIENIDKIKKEKIFKIYDLKTAFYTFAAPLAMGAILAGANNTEINKIFKIGLNLGRAFQIKDDIIGMFSEQKQSGKSSLTDLQEAKKTLLIWHAYNKNSKNKMAIKNILNKKKVTKTDLVKMRKLLKTSGSLDYAKNQISELNTTVKKLITDSRMRKKYKLVLENLTKDILLKKC